MALTKVTGSGANGLTLSSTDVTVASGDLLFGTANKGVVLGVTSNTDSNTLDDYEEGEFVAALDSSVTLHSDADTLSYTKIGRQVTVCGQIRISSSNSNDVVINNLPFTSIDGTDQSEFAVGAVRLYEYNMSNSGQYVICYSETGGTRLYFTSVVDDGVIIPLDADQNGYLMFSITYFTS